MARRVDLDRGLEPVRVPAEIVGDLCRHARESDPEECCGLVVGNSLERYLRSVRCQNVMTSMHQQDPIAHPRDNRSGFYMNPQEYARASEKAEASGEIITAVYHSHVGAGSYLSEMDLEYAEHPGFPFPDADQIVLPVFDGRVLVDAIALFRRTPGGFVGHPIEPTGR